MVMSLRVRVASRQLELEEESKLKLAFRLPIYGLDLLKSVQVSPLVKSRFNLTS